MLVAELPPCARTRGGDASALHAVDADRAASGGGGAALAWLRWALGAPAPAPAAAGAGGGGPGRACVAWHADSARLAVRDLDGAVGIYSLEGDGDAAAPAPAPAARGALAVLRDADQTGVRSLAWRPHGGNQLAVGCAHATVVLWSTKTAREPRGEEEALSAQRWRRCTRLHLAWGGTEAPALFAGAPRWTRGLAVGALAWSPCGSFLAAAVSPDGGAPPEPLGRARDAVLLCRGFSVFGAGALCAPGGGGGGGGRRVRMRAGLEVVESLAWSRDGGYLCAVEGGSGEIWVWETASWTCTSWVPPVRMERPLCLWAAAGGPAKGGADGASILLTVYHRAAGGRGAAGALPVASLLHMAGESPDLKGHMMTAELPELSDADGPPTRVESMAWDVRAGVLAVGFVRAGGGAGGAGGCAHRGRRAVRGGHGPGVQRAAPRRDGRAAARAGRGRAGRRDAAAGRRRRAGRARGARGAVGRRRGAGARAVTGAHV